MVSSLLEKSAIYKRGFDIIIGILFILFVVTWFFIQHDLDRTISSWFFLAEQKNWMLIEQQPWKWFYQYGTIPGVIFLIGLTGLLFLSYIKPILYSWRRYLILIILTSVIGGGVIVNGLLKDYWGRPRPRQIQEFEGVWRYQHPTEPGIAGKGKSFPCGHCSMGFSFVAIGFVYYRSKILAITGVTIGLIYGGLMSIARIGQGGHFATDSIWALGVTLLTGTFLYYFVLRIPIENTHEDLFQEARPRKVLSIGIGITLGVLFTILFFLTRRPVYDEYRAGLVINPKVQRLHIRTNMDVEHIKFEFIKSNEGSIQTNFQGFGFPGASHRVVVGRMMRGQILQIDYQIVSEGFFSEKNYEMQIKVPKRIQGKISIESSETKSETFL